MVAVAPSNQPDEPSFAIAVGGPFDMFAFQAAAKPAASQPFFLAATPAASGFTFGVTTPAAKPAASGFTFGATPKGLAFGPAVPAAATTNFGFTPAAATTGATGFSFGGATAVTPAATTGATGFFGTPAATTGANFGAFTNPASGVAPSPGRFGFGATSASMAAPSPGGFGFGGAASALAGLSFVDAAKPRPQVEMKMAEGSPCTIAGPSEILLFSNGLCVHSHAHSGKLRLALVHPCSTGASPRALQRPVVGV